MIKVPATEAGIPAIEELTARGVNVNVTLLFSVARYEQVIDAYIARPRAARGTRASPSTRSPRSPRSSSRASTPRPTPLLPADSDAARPRRDRQRPRAYRRYRDRFADERWLALRDAGARPQRPLWASTGTKDPAYSDVLYVERADRAGRHQHDARGDPARVRRPRRGRAARFDAEHRRGQRRSGRAEDAGVDLAAITAELERDGVRVVLRLLPASCSTASRPSSSEPARSARRDHDAPGNSV